MNYNEINNLFNKIYQLSNEVFEELKKQKRFK